MSVLFVGGLLIGIFLGRFFKVLVLVPAGCLGIFLICIRSGELGTNFFNILAQIVVLMTSLQIGYILSALIRGMPKETAAEVTHSKVIMMRHRSSARLGTERRKSWAEVASAALRLVHLR